MFEIIIILKFCDFLTFRKSTLIEFFEYSKFSLVQLVVIFSTMRKSPIIDFFEYSKLSFIQLLLIFLTIRKIHDFYLVSIIIHFYRVFESNVLLVILFFTSLSFASLQHLRKPLVLSLLRFRII